MGLLKDISIYDLSLYSSISECFDFGNMDDEEALDILLG